MLFFLGVYMYISGLYVIRIVCVSVLVIVLIGGCNLLMFEWGLVFEIAKCMLQWQ